VEINPPCFRGVSVGSRASIRVDVHIADYDDSARTTVHRHLRCIMSEAIFPSLRPFWASLSRVSYSRELNSHSGLSQKRGDGSIGPRYRSIPKPNELAHTILSNLQRRLRGKLIAIRDHNSVTREGAMPRSATRKSHLMTQDDGQCECGYCDEKFWQERRDLMSGGLRSDMQET
jgi:hypothetical protein